MATVVGVEEQGVDLHLELIKILLFCDIQPFPHAANYVNYFLIYGVN